MSKGDYFHDPDKPPKRQFRGWWIPAHIIYLFLDDTINAKELLLLATIDSFVQEKENGAVIGCFASNRYLGQQIKIQDPANVSKMISKLQRLGLLKIINRKKDTMAGRQNKRYIFTKWKRLKRVQTSK